MDQDCKPEVERTQYHHSNYRLLYSLETYLQLNYTALDNVDLKYHTPLKNIQFLHCGTKQLNAKSYFSGKE